ncbi:MAG: hypothetical protein LBC72_05025, partial [Spirochaetaceae bacterium]|nr:hypothetical protein [Spirochaetaceae bacterium]
MIRERFEQQLSLLHDNLTAMGALIEEAIERAAYALEHQDAALARQIIESDSVIDDKEKEIESLCL